MKLETFQQNMEQEGIWVLQDASNPMKAYVGREFPKDFENEITKYQVPSKILIDKDRLVLVSLTKLSWAGVKRFNRSHVEILTNRVGKIFLIAYKKDMEIVLDVSNEAGKTGQTLKTAFLSSGYITEREYEKYMDVDNRINLPVINITMV